MRLIFSILCFFLLFLPTISNAGVLWSSSWNYATGNSDLALTDGDVWYTNVSSGGNFSVSSGGPGENNYLNLYATPGDWGWDMDADGDGKDPGDGWTEPTDIYFRIYFRVHQAWVDDNEEGHYWATKIDPTYNSSQGHLMTLWTARRGACDAITTDFWIGFSIAPYSGNTIQLCNTPMNADQWYRWEVHIKQIDENYERWWLKLDGVDVTDRAILESGHPYAGYSLAYAYSQGWAAPNRYHGCVWPTIYDIAGGYQAFDFSCIEVRDDTWPGPVRRRTSTMVVENKK